MLLTRPDGLSDVVGKALVEIHVLAIMAVGGPDALTDRVRLARNDQWIVPSGHFRDA